MSKLINLRRRTASRINAAIIFACTPSDVWLLARMLCWAFALPMLKRTIPIERLARIMWSEPKANRCRAGRKRLLARLADWIYDRHKISGHCLERSLLLYRFLSEIGAGPHLVLGLNKTDGGWQGHAWVVVDGLPFDESTVALKKFSPVVVFKAGGFAQSIPR